jgi:hypothetical protein
MSKTCFLFILNKKLSTELHLLPSLFNFTASGHRHQLSRDHRPSHINKNETVTLIRRPASIRCLSTVNPPSTVELPSRRRRRRSNQKLKTESSTHTSMSPRRTSFHLRSDFTCLLACCSFSFSSYWSNNSGTWDRRFEWSIKYKQKLFWELMMVVMVGLDNSSWLKWLSQKMLLNVQFHFWNKKLRHVAQY